MKKSSSFWKEKCEELEKFNNNLQSKINALKEKLEPNNSQEWFNNKFLKDKGERTEIYIDGENLEGELKVEGFDKLERIDCFKNKLTNLKIVGCPNVKHLNASCNLLRNLDFLEGLKVKTDNKFETKLTYLSVHTNDLQSVNNGGKSSNLSLDFFKEFTNLEELYIDNYDEKRISKGVYNRFHDSLKPLESLINLRLLNISGTDIDSGLEYLPPSLRKIGCDAVEIGGKESKCSEIKKKLEEASEFWDGSKVALIKDEEGDTKWSRKWPRIAPWRKKYNLEKLENKKKVQDLEDIKSLEEKREIEDLRKEVAGEELIAEYQKIQEEIWLKRKESKRLLEELKKKLTDKSRDNSILIEIKNIEEEVKKLEVKEINIRNDLKSSNVVTKALLTPAWLLNNEGKLRENEDIKNPPYDSIYPESPFFINDWQEDNPSLKREFPTRLFNVERFIESKKGNKVDIKEIIKKMEVKEWDNYVYKKGEQSNGGYVCMRNEEKNDNIKDYAILSYIWGDTGGKKIGSNWSKKSLLKVIKALEVINKKINKGKEWSIKYLWMDQLCIDQDDIEKKAQEVRKMRQYYSNASVTLVAIHTTLGGNKIKFSEDGKSLDLDKILKIVVKSEWFSRSWTYQEGWLSKNTIFMFDNILIDGRDLAATWVLSQPSFTDHAKYNSLEELFKNERKIATPLGWVHYEGKYNALDKVTLRLNEALRAIKNRGRSVPIDGIYSILGLLPYGEHVKPSYKEGEEYTSRELQKALFDVMQVAWENGYGEIFAWHGSGDNWIPNVDANGKSSIEGGISIGVSGSKSLNFLKHKISKIYNNIVKIEGGGCTIGNGTWIKDVEVDDKKVILLSTREILEKVKKSDILLVPSNSKDEKVGWSINKHFAIIVREDIRENEKDTCRRLGLVEIKGKGLEKLQKGVDKLKMKEIKDINLSNLDNKLEFEGLFEISKFPKNN